MQESQEYTDNIEFELIYPFMDLRSLMNLSRTNSQYYQLIHSHLNRHYLISKILATTQYRSFSHVLTRELLPPEQLISFPRLHSPSTLELLDRKILEVLDVFFNFFNLQHKRAWTWGCLFSFYMLLQFFLLILSFSSVFDDQLLRFWLVFDCFYLNPLICFYLSHFADSLSDDSLTSNTFIALEYFLPYFCGFVKYLQLNLHSNDLFRILSAMSAGSCSFVLCGLADHCGKIFSPLSIPAGFWTTPPENLTSLSLSQLEKYSRNPEKLSLIKNEIRNLIDLFLNITTYQFISVDSLTHLNAALQHITTNAIFLLKQTLYHYEFLTNYLTQIGGVKKDEEKIDEETKIDQKLAKLQLKSLMMFSNPSPSHDYDSIIRRATGHNVFGEEEYFNMPCPRMIKMLDQQMHLFYFGLHGRKSANQFIRSIYKNAQTPGCGLIHTSFDPVLFADPAFSDSSNQNTVILYRQRLYYFDHIHLSVYPIDQNEEKNNDIENALDALKTRCNHLDINIYHTANPTELAWIENILKLQSIEFIEFKVPNDNKPIDRLF